MWGTKSASFPGEVIYRQGEEPDGLYLILGGTIKIFVTGEADETLLAMVNGNPVSGEMSVLDAKPRYANASAVGVCSAYFIPAEAFLDLLESSNGVCMRLLAFLVRRLRSTRRVPLSRSPGRAWSLDRIGRLASGRPASSPGWRLRGTPRVVGPSEPGRCAVG